VSKLCCDERDIGMPISYRIDEARALVLTTATGALTDADILGLKARLQVDPRWSPGMRELADVREIDRLDVTTEGVRRMASWAGAGRGPRQTAITTGVPGYLLKESFA
jgi:hypothetical protein